MKHSDYMKITWGLEHLMNSREFGIETLRVLFAKVEAPADPETLEPGRPAIKMAPADDARKHPLFPNRFLLLDSVGNSVDRTADLMDCCIDAWTETNQERADQGKKPTIDTMRLIPVMSAFMSATSTPIPGCVGLYDKVRTRCREWLGLANEWFPEIMADQGCETEPAPRESEPASTTETGTINRDKLADLFHGGFKMAGSVPGSEQKRSKFDDFYTAFASKNLDNPFTPTDIGRIAYQVQHCSFVLGRFRKMPFSKFAKLFFGACGVPVPKDISPRTYNRTTEKTDMQDWLE